VLERQNLFYEEYNNYVENLVSEYQKILWYRALWEEFMGGIYGRNLWEDTELFYIDYSNRIV
jgi:hypothetical protein